VIHAAWVCSARGRAVVALASGRDEKAAKGGCREILERLEVSAGGGQSVGFSWFLGLWWSDTTPGFGCDSDVELGDCESVRVIGGCGTAWFLGVAAAGARASAGGVEGALGSGFSVLLRGRGSGEPSRNGPVRPALGRRRRRWRGGVAKPLKCNENAARPRSARACSGFCGPRALPRPRGLRCRVAFSSSERSPGCHRRPGPRGGPGARDGHKAARQSTVIS
jgi:hypothetical protein